jgi:hypothetical protein
MASLTLISYINGCMYAQDGKQAKGQHDRWTVAPASGNTPAAEQCNNSISACSWHACTKWPHKHTLPTGRTAWWQADTSPLAIPSSSCTETLIDSSNLLHSHPFCFFLKAFTTSFTPLLICFRLDAFLHSFNTFLHSFSSANGLAICLLAWEERRHG